MYSHEFKLKELQTHWLSWITDLCDIPVVTYFSHWYSSHRTSTINNSNLTDSSNLCFSEEYIQ